MDFLTSDLSDEEVRELEAWREGSRLFEHLRDMNSRSP